MSQLGSFFDLITLIDWCKDAGFNIIQLLPLNDTDKDPSPYNALSAFALHPIYISTTHLPIVATQNDVSNFSSSIQNKKINFLEVLTRKLTTLKKYFQEHFPSIQKKEEYPHFLQQHNWLKSYAIFKVLKDQYMGKSWKKWQENSQNIEHLYHKYEQEANFHIFLQYIAFQQLQYIKNYANNKQILLEGDIPFLVGMESADVWAYPENFDKDTFVGAPPDMFNEKGQNWKSPPYQWETMRKNNFSWWKQRFSIAASFYHMCRIDHIIGFYRVWKIPRHGKSNEGYFQPQQPIQALQQGESLLTSLLHSSSLFPIGEDIAHQIRHIQQSLIALAIPGTRILLWQKQENSFLPYKEYPPCSLTTISTHDTEPLIEWWHNHPNYVDQFCIFKNWKRDRLLSLERRQQILYDSHHTASLFHINLLQEYLHLEPALQSFPIGRERINLPGTISDDNWMYRCPCLTQDLYQPNFMKKIEKILS